MLKPFLLHGLLWHSLALQLVAIAYNCASNKGENVTCIELRFYVVVGLIG
jgi:hypothetical protein